MKVDVVVCFYNQLKEWPLVRWGLEANAEQISRVIVVNDGEWGDTRLDPPANIPTIFLEHPRTGFGLCKSLNQGLGTSTTDYTLVIEGDEVLAPGSLAETLALASPKHLICARRAQMSDETELSHIESAVKTEVLSRAAPATYFAIKRAWRLCSGGHLLIHRPTHESIGGFDDRYGYGFHDFDYALRWELAGGTIVKGGGIVWHIGDVFERYLPSAKSYLLMLRQLQRAYGHRYNLGCGRKLAPDCINVDLVFLETEADVALDCVGLGWMEEGSADLICHSHFIEHLSLEDAGKHLVACARRLKVGGELHITFPDIYKIARTMLSGEQPEVPVLEAIYGDIHNPTLAGRHHKWGWGLKSLSDCIEATGLKVTYAGPDYGAVDLWRDSRVEAIKE